MTVLSATFLLFLVMDPVGNVPLFISSLARVDPARRQWVVVRELLIALGLMLIFLFCGKYMLKALHISEPALTVGGGVVLFLIALKMVFPSPDNSLHESVQGEPFVVPLAIPYVAGPSILATELLLMSQEPDRWPEWFLAVFLAWLISAIILYFSTFLMRLLGERGLIAIERLMGMVLITLAVQMIMTGVRAFIVGLPN